MIKKYFNMHRVADTALNAVIIFCFSMVIWLLAGISPEQAATQITLITIVCMGGMHFMDKMPFHDRIHRYLERNRQNHDL